MRTAFGFDGTRLYDELALTAGSFSATRSVDVHSGLHGGSKEIFSLLYLHRHIVREERNPVLFLHVGSVFRCFL
jgi:hypothetical protein